MESLLLQQQQQRSYEVAGNSNAGTQMRAELIIEFLLRSVKKSHELIHRFVAGIVIICLCRVAALLRKLHSCGCAMSMQKGRGTCVFAASSSRGENR